jgi:hypothetical protein
MDPANEFVEDPVPGGNDNTAIEAAAGDLALP